MQVLQQTAPISDMHKRQDSVIALMETGPVVLMARSRPKAVLVSPEVWNATAERLAYLEDIVACDAASARVKAGNYDTVADIDAIMSQ